ncbi:hypothetical protein LOZ80_10530 [Paenibacillus sp. HWE-109]|uniref:hypothetical protein n=1 Tax=Paenibacillus sp. HWE-109 TaxID=1306526 RepID=UPI001EDF0AEA|nr:hypothetical protein [Paenibacillus sp. HWE-109]UKS29335.1 hypothetical protein LOZ80_10530 [Paenibacillus sp. HWE-109]
MMDFRMSLEPHGWLDIVITSNEGTEIEIPASFLSDAISDLTDKTSNLLEHANEFLISIQTEPGEYRIKYSKISRELILFELYEMDDNFSSEELFKGKLLISEHVHTIKLLRMIYRELTKMKDLGMEEFKERWSYDFPVNTYDKISTSIKKLKQ